MREPWRKSGISGTWPSQIVSTTDCEGVHAGCHVGAQVSIRKLLTAMT